MKKPLIIQFNLHHPLFNNVLDGFSDEETNRRLNGNKNMNHVKYLAGHLLNSQYGLAMIAGLNPDIKWNELFAVMGQSEARDDDIYPDIEEIKAEWNGIHDQIREGLNALNEESLNAKPPEPFDQLTRLGRRIVDVHKSSYRLSHWSDRLVAKRVWKETNVV